MLQSSSLFCHHSFVSMKRSNPKTGVIKLKPFFHILNRGTQFINTMSYLTKKVMTQMCRDNKIKGYAGKKKNEIIELIENAGIEIPVNPNKVKTSLDDPYSPDVLKQRYTQHREYDLGITRIAEQTSIKFRRPGMPEDMSENIIKFIIHFQLNDPTSRWNCKKGDLHSEQEGCQECKCFTSDGPISFTPSSHWDIIYFLDAREWLSGRFVLYRCNLKRTSPEWASIRVNKHQTFEDQAKQGRRPRLGWNTLIREIEAHTTKVFDGSFNDIFTPSLK